MKALDQYGRVVLHPNTGPNRAQRRKEAKSESRGSSCQRSTERVIADRRAANKRAKASRVRNRIG